MSSWDMIIEKDRRDYEFVRAERKMFALAEREGWNFVSGEDNTCPRLTNFNGNRVVEFREKYVAWTGDGKPQDITEEQISSFLYGSSILT